MDEAPGCGEVLPWLKTEIRAPYVSVNRVWSLRPQLRQKRTRLQDCYTVASPCHHRNTHLHSKSGRDPHSAADHKYLGAARQTHIEKPPLLLPLPRLFLNARSGIDAGQNPCNAPRDYDETSS
jgi:hypothetical protein